MRPTWRASGCASWELTPASCGCYKAPSHFGATSLFLGDQFLTEGFMANTKSAEKRHRQNVKQREQNRAQRSRLRTAVKSLRQAVASGDAAKASEMLPE